MEIDSEDHNCRLICFIIGKIRFQTIIKYCNISRAYQSIEPAYNVELIIDAISILDFQLSHVTWFFSIFNTLRSLYCTYLFFEIFYFWDFSVLSVLEDTYPQYI